MILEPMIEKLRSLGRNLKSEILVYQLVIKDARTPRLAKWLLVLVVRYTVVPSDLIPGFIPVIGHLVDVIIVPILFPLALRMNPADVV